MSRMLRAWAVLAAGLLIGGQSASAATFGHLTTKDGIELIGIEGEIVAGDDDRFRALSLRYKSAAVLLDSDGGAIVPALEIGRIIRIAGYSTVVPEQATCASACALIWLAGSRRLLSPEGRLGFHASYANVDGKPAESGVANALVGSYLTQLNLPQRAIVFATQAAPDQISWLTERNKDYAGIDFDTLELDTESPRPAPPAGGANVQADPAALPPPVVVTVPPQITTPPGQPVGASPPMTLQKFTQYLKAEFRSPATLDELIKTFALPSEYNDLLKQHVIELYSNDLYIERLAREIYAIKDLAKDEAAMFSISKQIGSATTIKLINSGIARLNDEDVKTYIYYLSALPAKLSETECKIFFSEGGGSSAVELGAIAKLGPTHLANYLALQRRGIEAELTDYPATIVLSKDQVELARQAYGAALIAALEKLTSAESQRITIAIKNIDAANGKDMCDSYYMMYRIYHNLEGLPGTWSRRELVQEVARQ